MVKPLKKEFSIILRKLSYTVLLLSTLFFVRCGSSDAVDSLDALGTLDSKETDALLNKITLNNEHVKEENLNNEISLYLGEKLVFNIPHATELFDADQNDNTQIKAKITNQEDKTLLTFVIEGNTLTIDPRKIGTGTFTLAYTTSYNNLGIVINNKIKKIISDSFTKKINYKIIQNLNMITVPEKFPKIISVTQHIEKTTTLPAVMDRFRKLVLPEILPEISPMENAPKLNLLGNILSITSSTIGNKTITLKYKTLEKVHTDERLYTSTTQTLDIIIITYAQENTITIPANISTTFTVTQNIPKTLSLPVVTDSLGTEILGTENDAIATLNGKLLTIISPIIGTKNITLTYTSQATYGKTATTQTINILLTTVAPVQNTITIPANISTTFTVTQNVPKTLTLPTVTDSFNTAIVPTVNDPVATLNGNDLIITSPTIGTKTITLTYTSQAINGKAVTIQTTSILLTTVAPVQNTITIPANISTTFTVTQNVPKTLTLPTVTNSFNTAIVPTVNDPVATLNGNALIIISPTIGTKTITLTYTSQAINGKVATTQTASILLTTVAPIQNTITIPANFTTTFTVIQNVTTTLTLPTITDSFNTAIIPTVNDPVATLNGNDLIITSPTIGTKPITLTYTSQAINGNAATTQTVNIRLVTVSAISLKNELKIVHNKYVKGTQVLPFKGFYPIDVYVGSDQRNTVEIITFQDVAGVDVIPTFSFNSPRFSLNIVKDEIIEGQIYNRYKVEFQYLGGTGNEEVLVDIIWTTQAKIFRGIRYDLVDSYTNSIKVKVTDQFAKTYTYPNEVLNHKNSVRELFSKRDGEVIQINLGLRETKNISTIPPAMYERLYSYLVPTFILNNEGDSSLSARLNRTISNHSPLGVNVTSNNYGSILGKGVIKVIYKSKRAFWPWTNDIDNDGALDNVIYTSVTVTLYIEINGAKKDEATFPNAN